MEGCGGEYKIRGGDEGDGAFFLEDGDGDGDGDGAVGRERGWYRMMRCDE